MEILLRYCQQQVQIFHVRSPHGCRLFYDPERNDQMLLEPLKQELFGPDQFEQLEFPQCETTNPGQEEHTYKLLTALDRGMLLECHNGNIYATRKSRCVPFFNELIYSITAIRHTAIRHYCYQTLLLFGITAIWDNYCITAIWYNCYSVGCNLCGTVKHGFFLWGDNFCGLI